MSEYNFNKLPNETDFQHLKRVCVDKINKLHNKEWTDIKEEFNFQHSSDNLRKYSKGWHLEWEAEIESTTLTDEESEALLKQKVTTEILADGSHKSDRLIVMSENESKSPEYLLQAHGFDHNQWELISARNNIWNVSAGDNPNKVLYSSRISVKPKVNVIDFDTIIKSMKETIKPENIKSKVDDGTNLLEIPLFDMHWGIADWEYYIPVFEKLINKIKSKKWDTVLFIIGQDLLHTDGFTGKTTSGTIIGNVDIAKAWKEAFKFYSLLIESALENSKNVYGYFSNGNHDQAISWALVQALEIKYPQVNWDSEMKERKAFIWEDIFIGFTHGDKAPVNRITGSFMNEFGRDIAKAQVIEIQSGHLHFEESKDVQGIVFRRLASGAKTDQWHYEKSFVGARKKFQIFEYTKDSLEGINFI